LYQQAFVTEKHHDKFSVYSGYALFANKTIDSWTFGSWRNSTKIFANADEDSLKVRQD
jgi:hypothetical protein